MNILTRFLRDARGSSTRRFANVAVVAALLAVIAAGLLDRLTRDGGASLIAFLLPEDPARHAVQTARDASSPYGIDMTPTGAIGTVVLDPCTGKQK